jgi:hypothetical protein
VIPLTGGRLTQGVVRIGNTARRPASAKSAVTADLLQLLEQRGFSGAPRYLGQDAEGRDILTYLDGWVPPKLQRWQDYAGASPQSAAGRARDARKRA